MSETCEFGKCEICGENKILNRTYYRYDIKCEYHSPQHFEIVHHCNKCVPKEPIETKITMKTKDLKKYNFRKEKLDKILDNE